MIVIDGTGWMRGALWGLWGAWSHMGAGEEGRSVPVWGGGGHLERQRASHGTHSPSASYSRNTHFVPPGLHVSHFTHLLSFTCSITCCQSTRFIRQTMQSVLCLPAWREDFRALHLLINQAAWRYITWIVDYIAYARLSKWQTPRRWANSLPGPTRLIVHLSQPRWQPPPPASPSSSSSSTSSSAMVRGSQTSNVHREGKKIITLNQFGCLWESRRTGELRMVKCRLSSLICAAL